MNKILDMREKRAKLWDAAKAFGDTHKAEDGTMMAEDKAAWEKMADDIDRMGREIERLEREETIDIEMNRATDMPIQSRPSSKFSDVPGKKGRASDEYKAGFWQMIRNRSNAIPYEVRNALEVGTDTEGGYLVLLAEDVEPSVEYVLHDEGQRIAALQIQGRLLRLDRYSAFSDCKRIQIADEFPVSF